MNRRYLHFIKPQMAFESRIQKAAYTNTQPGILMFLARSHLACILWVDCFRILWRIKVATLCCDNLPTWLGMRNPLNGYETPFRHKLPAESVECLIFHSADQKLLYTLNATSVRACYIVSEYILNLGTPRGYRVSIIISFYTKQTYVAESLHIYSFILYIDVTISHHSVNCTKSSLYSLGDQTLLQCYILVTWRYSLSGRQDIPKPVRLRRIWIQAQDLWRL